MKADVVNTKTLRLGLIGGNITESRSPALQIVCGLSASRNVSYDLLIPAEHGISFEAMLKRCEAAGFDGVNVTYPFKEEVTKLVAPGESVVTALGAANTVTFSGDRPLAYNTDHTGFIAAYRARWGGRLPGRVLIIGAGGVGRAIAFALTGLGASELLLHDTSLLKANALCGAIQRHARKTSAIVAAEIPRDMAGIDGLVNATPLGMTGRPGSPLSSDFTGGPGWAFDAVYTPEHTPFRAQAEKFGADFLSGYELYFHQGIQAFRIFSGTEAANPGWVQDVLMSRKQQT